MAMNQTPTLILGIGGIGCRITANISALLRPEDRQHIALVGMDTNVNDLKKMEDKGIRTIQTSDTRKVSDYLKMHPEYMSWFPVNQFTVSRGMLNGAGQIRAISRLAALAAEENGMFVPIKEEIQRIRANRGDNGNGNLTVMVVGSVTGGTGAGLFLQMPFYIRKIMQGESGLENIIIRGMFVGPDLTVDVQPSKINKSAVRVNGYACLKELNAMYMRQTHGELEGKLRVDFYTPSNADKAEVAQDIMKDLENSEYFDPAEYDLGAVSEDSAVIAKGNPEIPYDYLYLIEGSNAKGGIGNAPLSSVESLVGRMVHTLMFTPVSDNALSVEDNMVLQDMEKGGMNRYSSAGLSRLIYPKEQACDYVTLCTIRDLVQEEWLIVDQAFNDEVAEARSRQRTDGQVKIPVLKTAFLNHYTKQVKGEGRLGRLYSEAFYKTKNNTEVSRSAILLDELKEQIKAVTDSAEVKAAQADCTLSLTDMKSFGAADEEISRVYTAMEDYTKLVKRLVRENGIAIANELFPPSWQSLSQRMDKEKGIYGLLGGVHPLTARFLCYDLMKKLESKVTDQESKVNSLVLDGYVQVDYDSKTEETQTAAEALENLQEDVIPIIGPLINMVVGENKRLEYIRTKLNNTVNVHRQKNTEYLNAALELAACRVLIKRLEQLAENYRVFFQGIGNMIAENNERIEMLENLELPLGQIGVYCSKDAFRSMAIAYRNQVDSELSAATKKAIFTSLFKVLAEDFAHEGKEETERQKNARIAKKTKTLNNIFRTAVVNTVRTEVVEKGDGIVDMNVRQALELQCALDEPETEDSTEYLQKQIRKGMNMAAPMLATSNNALAENTETVYLAMHPDCAALEMGEPDAGATKKLFAPQADESTDGLHATVLLDEAFSPYELTCFKARYKFNIEDLTKYAPGSENAKAYEERIRNLGNRVTNPLDPDSFKTVVSPHLDRYWHEEAYLPSIYATQRVKDDVDTLRAFIYAMGLDSFRRIVNEDVLDQDGNGRLTWYLNTKRTLEPVKVRGSLIGNSYTDLLNSLSYNGKTKRYLLRLAKDTMQAEKGFRSAEELFETIQDHWFIADLIQAGADRNGEPDENILDIFLQMRESMPEEAWKRLFVGLQTVLWEFCAFLFNENERMVNTAVKAVAERMVANCAISKKNATRLTYTERELIKQMEGIGAAQYRRI